MTKAGLLSKYFRGFTILESLITLAVLLALTMVIIALFKFHSKPPPPHLEKVGFKVPEFDLSLPGNIRWI